MAINKRSLADIPSMSLPESSPAHSLISGPQKAAKRLPPHPPAANSAGNCYAQQTDAPTPGWPTVAV